MRDEILFYEIQPFWRNRPMIAVAILVIAVFISRFVQYAVWDTNSIIATAVVFLVLGGIFFLKLQTVITEEGIYVRYFPLIFRTRFFAWEDIEKAYVRKYSPVREYGGWGIRFNIIRGSKAYNVYGNIGLQLVFNNGKKLLIGTNRAEELAEVLKKINDKREQK